MMELNEVEEPVELEEISPYSDGAPDDIFICCGSPEERCTGGALIIGKDYAPHTVLLIRYSGDNPKRTRNIEAIRKKFSKSDIYEYSTDEDKPIPIISEITEKVDGLSKSSSNLRICIDISTMIKWHLLLLLKALDAKKLLSHVRFIYTEPEEYVTDLIQPLSFGIKEIFPIPLFSGDYDFYRDSLLVLMLGYEGNRAMALFEKTDPTECLLLVGYPAYRKEWEGRTEEMNKAIIELVGEENTDKIHTLNPLKVASGLKEVLSSEKYHKFNHIISPLGTKPQILGLYLYLSDEPENTSILYGAPLRHNDLFYSKGIGKTWHLPFKK